MTTPITRHSFTAVLLLLLVQLAACSEPLPKITPLADDAVMLAFGDSITHGNGAAPGEAYPAVLAELSGHSVINAGLPGEISGNGRARLPALLDLHRPGLLILCHGGNDLLRKIEATVTRDNLAAMISMAHERDIPVMLIGVPKPGLFLLDSAEMYAELASGYGLLYDGEILPEVYSKNALKSDHIHPNAAGYRRIAEAIYGILQDSGAL